MAIDRQIQTVLTTGEITSIKLGGSTSQDELLKRSEIEGLTNSLNLRVVVIEDTWYGVTNPGTPIITLNADTTKYDMVAFTYYIKGVKYLFPATTISAGFGAPGTFMSISVDSTSIGGVPILKIGGFPTPTELKTRLEIGRIASSDGTNITSIGDSVFFSSEFMENLAIRFKSFEGAKFFGDGGKASANATPMRVDIAAGEVNTANLQTQAISAETAVNAFPVYAIAGVTAIRPEQTPLEAQNTQYDNGTDLAAIPAGQYVSHSLLRSNGTGEYYLQYGRDTFTELSAAVASGFVNTLFNIQGAEVEPLAKIIVQEGAAGISQIVDVRKGAALAAALVWVPSYAAIYISTTALTLIAAVDTPIAVAGTYLEIASSSDFTVTAGVMTYTGTDTRLFDVTASLSFITSNNNKNVSFYVAKNGVAEARTRQQNFVATGADTKVIGLNDFAELSTGDTVEVFAENNTDGTDVTVNYLNFDIKAIN